MFAYTSQTNYSHCQQQAIHTLQNIFPSANLPHFSKNSSLWELLQKSAKNLPRPALSDITSAIENMKCVVDSQELKIQKNMIEIEKCQENIMASHKHYDNSRPLQQHIPINFMLQRDNHTHHSLIHYEMDHQIDHDIDHDLSHPMDNYEKIEMNKKDEFMDKMADFYCQQDEMDYFQQQPHEDQNPFDYLTLGF